jgi:hypothetical protein
MKRKKIKEEVEDYKKTKREKKKKEKEYTHVDDIPDEILAIIMGYLETQCFRCQLVCKKWRYVFRYLYTSMNPLSSWSLNMKRKWKIDLFSLSPSLFERFVPDTEHKHRYCEYAACSENLELLKWVRSKGYEWREAGKIMVQKNRLDMLEWSLANGCKVDFHIKNSAIEKGDINALEIIKKYDSCQFGELEYFEAIRKAHFHVLEWLCERGCPMKPCSVKRSEEHICGLEEWMCEEAVKSLRLNVLKWLKEHNCPWNVDMCICVDTMNIKHNLQALDIFQGYSWYSYGEAIETMTIVKSEIIAWLNANNCPCGGKYHQENKIKKKRKEKKKKNIDIKYI